MKGGKRLTEEERVEWIGFVHAQNKRMVTVERKAVIYKEIIDDLEAWLERDDEPESCTCGKPADHSVMEHSRWICGHCGKPVEGE